MKAIITFIGILFCAIIMAQNNYYIATKTFKESGYTYQCDVPSYKLVTLYNKENKWTYVNQVYKDTGKPFIMPNEGIELVKDDNWTDAKCSSIVNAAFSSDEKLHVRGRELIISLVINSSTGKVDEVYFNFVNFGPYATIPVSVFRKIEVELKKNVWFNPTSEGKKLNYILHWWGQDPSEPI